MHPERKTIGDLLYQRQPFVVPKYQRAYAWQREEIDDFVNDLRTCFDMRSNGQKRNHFFGGIVSVHHIAPGTIAGRKYEVVDGQQRLATFSILFCLIAKAYDALAKKAKRDKQYKGTELSKQAAFAADKLRKDFLKYDEGPNRQLFRVELSKADKEFFESLLDGKKPKATHASHKRLRYAYRTIDKNLVKSIVVLVDDLQQKYDNLTRLSDTAKEDCYVMHLTTETKPEAYRLFQVLNDRGSSLTEGDLLKSTTLELLEDFPIIQEKAEEDWKHILKREFGMTEQFLRAFQASRTGKRPGKRTLFDDFYEAFFKSQTPVGQDQAKAEQVQSEIHHMRDESTLYAQLVAPQWPFDSVPEVTEWDRKRLNLLIQTLRHKLCLPLLLAARQLTPADRQLIV
jgi:uncharacterized protein with ParB-like and HNH nuclease domain